MNGGRREGEGGREGGGREREGEREREREGERLTDWVLCWKNAPRAAPLSSLLRGGRGLATPTADSVTTLALGKTVGDSPCQLGTKRIITMQQWLIYLTFSFSLASLREMESVRSESVRSEG